MLKILIWRSGSLQFRAMRGGQEISGNIEGGVAPFSTSYPVLSFSPNGDWESRERDVDDVGGVHF